MGSAGWGWYLKWLDPWVPPMVVGPAIPKSVLSTLNFESPSPSMFERS